MNIARSCLAQSCFPVAAFAAVIVTVGTASAGPLDRFAGRWAGWGKLSLTNGNSEKMKCVTTYVVSGAGTKARQNLRCASPSYRIDAVVNLGVNGRRLVGNWREQIFSIGGTLKGATTKTGLRAIFRSDTLVGSLSISSGKCRQSLDIRTKGVEISGLSVDLARC